MTQRRAVLLLFATLLCRAQTPLGDDWYVVALDSVKSEVTLRHLGNIYKALCGRSDVLLLQRIGPYRRDAVNLKDGSVKQQPCGQVMAPYVGKSIANWSDASPPIPSADGWRVGMELGKTPPGKPGILLLHKGPQPGRHDEAYQEWYIILSVTPAK
jgi:hypothetical protein